MENNNIINYQFSIFGNFQKIHLSINDVANLIGESFKKNVVPELTNVGPVNCYQLIGNTVSMVFRPNRMDFVYKNIGDNDIDIFKRYLERISSVYEINIDRFAINFNYFVRDHNFEKTKIISDQIPFLKSCGVTTNFNMIKNNVFNLDGVPVNNIMRIQNGIVQEKNTFNQIQSISILIDINTVPGSFVNYPKNKIYLFADKFYKEGLDKIDYQSKEIDELLN